MKPFRRLFEFYNNLRMHSKLMIGYFLVVVVPTVVLSAAFFWSDLHHLQAADRVQKSQNLRLYAEQFDDGLSQLSSYSNFFQDQESLEDYLTGEYGTVSETLFAWLSSIKDTYTCYSGDSRVLSITVYGLRDYPISFPGYLEPLSKNPELQNTFSEIQKVKYGDWQWKFADVNTMVYYRPLYGNSLSMTIGLLAIRADFSDFSSVYSLPEGSGLKLYLLDNADGMLYSAGENGLKLIETQTADDILARDDLLTGDIESLGMTLVAVSKPYSVPRLQILLYFLMTVISLLLFSLIYIAIERLLIGRLIEFTAFISMQDAHDLKEYPGVIYRDEIGDVKRNYNQLVRRINTLIHDNYEVSLKAKEARYYALQSQIRPHALYNVLENIRMSSLAHGDQDTAHLTEVFGRYMRYILNSDSSEASLEEELEAARSYLEVCRMRIGEELEYVFSVETELSGLSCPRFLFQTLIENSVNHGYIHGKVLHIKISVQGTDGSEMAEDVLVRVLDDGAGINEAQLSAMQEVLDSSAPSPGTRHVGLHNVNDRLKAMNLDGSGLKIRSSSGQGTEVSFHLYRNEQHAEKTDSVETERRNS